LIRARSLASGETLDTVVNMDNTHLFDPQTEKTLDL
jgi:hypothetical protein